VFLIHYETVRCACYHLDNITYPSHLSSLSASKAEGRISPETTSFPTLGKGGRQGAKADPGALTTRVFAALVGDSASEGVRWSSASDDSLRGSGCLVLRFLAEDGGALQVAGVRLRGARGVTGPAALLTPGDDC